MKIELNEWEINTILNVLGEQPYNKTASIIKHITEQIERGVECDPERNES